MTILRKNCNCIALFSYEKEDFDYKKWNLLIENVLARFNLNATHIGIGGKNYFKNSVPAAIAQKKLVDRNFKEIENLSIYVTPEGSDSPLYDWFFLAINGETVRGRVSILCFDEEFMNFYSTQFDKLLKELSIVGIYEYGIGYRRTFAKGPSSYALGMVEGVERNKPESNTISYWYKDRLNGNKVKDGLIRDVYPYNILSKVHLNMIVEGKKFEDWINDKSVFDDQANRGIIEYISDDLYLWRVEKENIAKIRTKLAPILISYHPDVIASLI